MLDLYRNPLIQGMTTNPTLMKKAGITYYEAFAKDVLQTVQTKPGAKTSTLDSKTGQIYLITAEMAGGGGGGGRRAQLAPDSFMILVVGR